MLYNLQTQYLPTSTPSNNYTAYNQTASTPTHPPSAPHITKKLHIQLRMHLKKIAPLNKKTRPLLHTTAEQTDGGLKSSSQNRLTPEELNPFNPLRVAPLLSRRKQDHNAHEQDKPHNAHHHPSHPIKPFVEFDTLDWQPVKTPQKSLPPESKVYSARVPNEPLSALRCHPTQPIRRGTDCLQRGYFKLYHMDGRHHSHRSDEPPQRRKRLFEALCFHR